MSSRYFILLSLLFLTILKGFSQEAHISFQLGSDQSIESFQIKGQTFQIGRSVPLFSYQIGESLFSSIQPSDQLAVSMSQDGGHWKITFSNISQDTIQLHNVIPFSKEGTEVYITGNGNHGLSRTHLFLPGKVPVNVIVPDNAWDLGYAGLDLDGESKIASLTRRDRESIQKGSRRRFETYLFPGGSVEYLFYLLPYSGTWQNGLTEVFQRKMLCDIAYFENELFERKDLQWIRHSYIMHLMYAWDKFYYDIDKEEYTLQDFLARGKKLYGGDDVVSIWPTWPTLGLDQRNQFELFEDLPGGLEAMRSQAQLSREKGTKFFVCYNPWDVGTEEKDHFEGLYDLILATDADGVVLDTKAEAGKEFQDAADRAKSGVIMYSEGMAVPKSMPTIVSGRVHNALYSSDA